LLNAAFKWRRPTIMNKFRRFSGRISAERCLKMDYFGSKSPKIAKRWPPPPDPLACRGWGGRPPTPPQDKIGECAILYSHRNYWLMQMLGNFWAKTKLMCYISPSPVHKISPRHYFMLALNKVYLFFFSGRQPCPHQPIGVRDGGAGGYLPPA